MNIVKQKVKDIIVQQLGVDQVRFAESSESRVVESILREAADWLEASGKPMWRQDELDSGRIAAEVAEQRYALAFQGDEAAGTLRFELEDELFWPDRPRGEAAYLHRLAVRPRHAGGAVSTALLHWAVAHGRELGRGLLRLDCEAPRPALREFTRASVFACTAIVGSDPTSSRATRFPSIRPDRAAPVR